MSAAVAPMSLRTRSNLSQSTPPTAQSAPIQPPAATPPVNNLAVDSSNMFTKLPKEDSIAQVEEQQQPTVDPNLAYSTNLFPRISAVR